MTTAMGQIMATILSGVRGRWRRRTSSARVAAARTQLLKQGRVVGGTVPYGWRSLPNPDGPGKVLRHDPDRIEWVRGMVERCQRGDTLYIDHAVAGPRGRTATKGAGGPEGTPGATRASSASCGTRSWLGQRRSTRATRARREATELLRDERGLPVVDPAWPSCRCPSGARWWTSWTTGTRPRPSRGPCRPQTSACCPG